MSEPVITAGGVTVLLGAVASAVWGAGVPPVVSAIISAVAAGIAVAINTWARGKVTPTDDPKLDDGTQLVPARGVVEPYVVQDDPPTEQM